MRILNFSFDRPGLRFLKPWAVFATPAEPGDYRVTCAEGIGADILADFDLEPQQVLWVEHFQNDPGHLHVAEFSPHTEPHPAPVAGLRWRPIRSNELDVIRCFIPEAEFIEISLQGPIRPVARE